MEINSSLDVLVEILYIKIIVSLLSLALTDYLFVLERTYRCGQQGTKCGGNNPNNHCHNKGF